MPFAYSIVVKELRTKYADFLCFFSFFPMLLNINARRVCPIRRSRSLFIHLFFLFSRLQSHSTTFL